MSVQKWKLFLYFLSCEFSFDSGVFKIFRLKRLHASFSPYSFKIIERLKQRHLTANLNNSFDAKMQNPIGLFSEVRKTVEWISIPIAHKHRNY